MDAGLVERLFASRCVTERSARYDPATRAVTPERRRRLGAITLSRGPDSSAEPAAVSAALEEAVREHGLHLLRSEEHTSELQSVMRISYADFCLKKKSHYQFICQYTH